MTEEKQKIYITPGIKALILESEDFTKFVAESVNRHINHDWGDTYDEDKELNERYPESAMSTYRYSESLEIWVKSENGYIIVLLPSEY